MQEGGYNCMLTSPNTLTYADSPHPRSLLKETQRVLICKTSLIYDISVDRVVLRSDRANKQADSWPRCPDMAIPQVE